MKILHELEKAFHGTDDQTKIDMIEKVKDFLHEVTPIQQPVDRVKWVDIDMVQANDYNPNSVAGAEMKLYFH